MGHATSTGVTQLDWHPKLGEHLAAKRQGSLDRWWLRAGNDSCDVRIFAWGGGVRLTFGLAALGAACFFFLLFFLARALFLALHRSLSLHQDTNLSTTKV